MNIINIYLIGILGSFIIFSISLKSVIKRNMTLSEDFSALLIMSIIWPFCWVAIFLMIFYKKWEKWIRGGNDQK